MTRTPGKFGVRPPEQRAGIVIPKFRDYLTGEGDPFPYVNPLSTFDGTSGVAQLGMLGNDVWGDCVFAGYVHARMLQAWLAGVQPVGNYSDTAVWPSDDEVITAYLKYNGSPDPGDHNPNGPNAAYDNGADPDEALAWFMENAIGPLSPLGEGDGGYADVNDYGEELEGGIAGFGVLWNAVMVSQEAMNEFQAGLPFSSTATDFIGGHLFPISYRDAEKGKGPTWGIEQEFTWPWWRVSRELSRVILSPEILKALKFFDATQLKADVRALGGTIGIKANQPAPSAEWFAPGGRFAR